LVTNDTPWLFLYIKSVVGKGTGGSRSKKGEEREKHIFTLQAVSTEAWHFLGKSRRKMTVLKSSLFLQAQHLFARRKSGPEGGE